MVITTLWLLADSVGWARLLLLMVTAIVAMVAWIIVAHHLWEAGTEPGKAAEYAVEAGRSVQHGCEVADTLAEVINDDSLSAVALLHDLEVHPRGKELLAEAPVSAEERTLIYFRITATPAADSR